MVEGKIVITGRYPTNEEFAKLLDLPEIYSPFMAQTWRRKRLAKWNGSTESTNAGGKFTLIAWNSGEIKGKRLLELLRRPK